MDRPFKRTSHHQVPAGCAAPSAKSAPSANTASLRATATGLTGHAPKLQCRQLRTMTRTCSGRVSCALVWGAA
eukprot:CAMPEP_0175883080 /NCGR_PEP_ID=MMETSP0107_2-20121207/43773_1 /TAXON_ID=195067 ORGANISM="Goniomonas pacifica, Strain CCMP1869" /NCGR_SAMPLE_ID=MMETSP0107_2 /ASSEMBLY_ACC=CAM_ASM_000203 /LENGTH=72 /DNA_ID=CAMNT_0017203093 /DNA_START=203 /DNA_END=421 /DNA_ORIENTATION=+